MSTVGSELLNEIERVAAKRERWKGYQADMGASGLSLTFGIISMGMSIEAAKAAIQSNDPAMAADALESLRGFNEED